MGDPQEKMSNSKRKLRTPAYRASSTKDNNLWRNDRTTESSFRPLRVKMKAS